MRYIRYISFLALFLQGCNNPSTEVVKELSFVRLSHQNNYTAGDAIQLQFDTEENSNAVLLVKNAFGIAVVRPIMKGSMLTFNLPDSFTNKAGRCYWQLMADGKRLESGELQIAPNTKKKTAIETYLGPISITAGNVDYSMLVAIPTDVYDNPLSDETQVLVKHQFQDDISESSIHTNHLVAWKNIYSPMKAGRLLISASSNQIASKEMTSIVYAAKATDFTIDFQRNHKYADGNQIITFSTSTIKDAYGNTISDGTLVSFRIIDASGMQLQTTGTTLNGVAEAKLLHPAQKDVWSINAYITGAAKSSPIQVAFESAVKDYDVVFGTNNREVTIGPIQSFMRQLVPDGLPIQIKIINESNKVLNVKHETSRDGLANMTLSPDFFPNGSYTISIQLAGNTKTIQVDLN